MSSPNLPDPERTRRLVGGGCLTVAVLGGIVALSIALLVPPLLDPQANALEVYGEMLLSAALALPAGLVYLTVPRLLDRYDPEPWYALLGCMLWGGIVATAISIYPNSCVAGVLSGNVGEVVSSTFVAPVIEEGTKGLAIFGVFYFLRREFDGVVDGVIYATFTAISFAAVENVIYYSNAMHEGADAFRTVA